MYRSWILAHLPPKKRRLAPAMEGKDLRSSLHSLRDHQDQKWWGWKVKMSGVATCNFIHGAHVVWYYVCLSNFDSDLFAFDRLKCCFFPCLTFCSLKVLFTFAGRLQKPLQKHIYLNMKNKNHLSNLKSMVIFWDLVKEQSLQAIQEILDTYEVSLVAPRVLWLKKRSIKIS